MLIPHPFLDPPIHFQNSREKTFSFKIFGLADDGLWYPLLSTGNREQMRTEIAASTVNRPYPCRLQQMFILISSIRYALRDPCDFSSIRCERLVKSDSDRHRQRSAPYLICWPCHKV